jgi:hypothetical protein
VCKNVIIEIFLAVAPCDLAGELRRDRECADGADFAEAMERFRGHAKVDRRQPRVVGPGRVVAGVDGSLNFIPDEVHPGFSLPRGVPFSNQNVSGIKTWTYGPCVQVPKSPCGLLKGDFRALGLRFRLRNLGGGDRLIGILVLFQVAEVNLRRPALTEQREIATRRTFR